jgi:hypothetical protein
VLSGEVDYAANTWRGSEVQAAGVERVGHQLLAFM